MSVRSAQVIVAEFTTRLFVTGAASNADSLPTGTLIVNGTDNAAVVTVGNVATGRYKASVTLPILDVGDVVEINVAVTMTAVTDNAIIFRDTCDNDISAASVMGPVTLAAGQHVIVDSGTVTTLTNLPAITTGWLTAAGIDTNALNGKGDWSTYAGGAVASVSAGVTLADGAITDAKIAFPAEAAGRPSTFLAACRRLWEWATNKRDRNRSTGVVTLYGANDTTPLETQTQSTVGSTDSQSKGA